MFCKNASPSTVNSRSFPYDLELKMCKSIFVERLRNVKLGVL